MKNWWKILTLCLVGSVSATIFTGCYFGPKLDASHEANQEQTTDENTDDTSTDENQQTNDNNQDNVHDQTNETNPDEPNHQDTPTTDDPVIDTPTNNENSTTDDNETEPTTPQDPALHQHTSDNIWHVTKAATCTEDGLEVLYCTECGEVIDSRAIPATGHLYTDHVTAPTCTAGGYTTHHCSRCSDSYKDNYTAINPQNHHYDETTHQCACGATDPNYQPTQDLGPIQNPAGTYWFFAEKNFALYFKDFNGKTNKGTYCSFKGSFANGVFTKDLSRTSDYNGTYEIVPPSEATGSYKIKFHDYACESYKSTDTEDKFVPDFVLTYHQGGNPVVYTLQGDEFINRTYTDKTLTFARCASGV